MFLLSRKSIYFLFAFWIFRKISRLFRQQRRLRTTRHIMHSSAYLYESHEIRWLANYKWIKKRNIRKQFIIPFHWSCSTNSYTYTYKCIRYSCWWYTPIPSTKRHFSQSFNSVCVVRSFYSHISLYTINIICMTTQQLRFAHTYALEIVVGNREWTANTYHEILHSHIARICSSTYREDEFACVHPFHCYGVRSNRLNKLMRIQIDDLTLYQMYQYEYEWNKI